MSRFVADSRKGAKAQSRTALQAVDRSGCSGCRQVENLSYFTAATRLSAIIHPPSYIAASGYRSSDILHQLRPYAELEIPTGWALYYRGAWAVGW